MSTEIELRSRSARWAKVAFTCGILSTIGGFVGIALYLRGWHLAPFIVNEVAAVFGTVAWVWLALKRRRDA